MNVKEQIADLDAKDGLLAKEEADAGKVERLFRESPLAEAFDAVESEMTARWKSSPWTDKEGREKIFLEMHALKAVKANLQRVLNRGAQAAAERPTIMERIKRLKAGR